MNNLTTRKIVLGMLMTLVLAFSVQGTADALTFGNHSSSDGDLRTVYQNQEFTIRVPVTPKGAERRPGYASVPSTDIDDNSVPAAQRTNMYYDNTDGSGFTLNDDLPVNYAAAYFYDQEQITIAIPEGSAHANITKVGSHNVPSGSANGFVMYERTHNMYDDAANHQRLSGSFTLTLEPTTDSVGKVVITITDSTNSADIRGGVVSNPIAFTVYIVNYQSDIDNNVTNLASDRDGVEYAFDNDVRPMSDYFAFPGTDVPVHYSIEGSGSFSIRENEDYPAGSPISVKTFSRTLSTSDDAPVFIDMKRSTNKVTAWVSGGTSRTIIFIYSGPNPDKYPEIGITQGINQIGATESRLEDSLKVKVTDGSNRPLAGVAVGFASTDPDSPTTPSMFIPVPGTVVYGSGTTLTQTIGTAALVNNTADTTTATSLKPEAGEAIFVQTDRNGVAEVYFQLSSDKGAHQVTATLQGETSLNTTFDADAVDASRSASLVLVSGNNQRADADTHDVEDPLVVRVRRPGGYRIADVTIRFTALTGVLEPARGTAYARDDDGQIGPDNGQEIYVSTNAHGEAGVVYNAGQITGAKTVTARVDDEEKTTQYDFQIRQVEFHIDGRAAPPRDDTIEDDTAPAPPVTVSVPSTVTGDAGGTATLTVTAATTETVTIGGLGDTFPRANASGVTRSGTTFTSTLTLPDQVADYSLTVFVGNTRHPVTVSVTAAPVQTGTLTVRVDPFNGAPGTTATVTITAIDSNDQPANVTVTLSAIGGTLASSSVPTGTAGTATVSLTRGTTPGSGNYVTAAATGTADDYESVQGRFLITGTAPPTTTTTTPTTRPEAGEPAFVEIYDGDRQSGPLNAQLRDAFVVEVLDEDDNPVEDVRVGFQVTQGSGRISPRSARTDESGFAEVNFTPISPGEIVVRARVSGVDAVDFTVTAGDPPASLDIVSGDNQAGNPGSRLANALVVEVQDEDGEAIEGIRVAFSVTAGGGSLSETSDVTDEDGRAQTMLTLGSERAVNSVQASVSDLDPVTFNTSIDAVVHVAAANRPVMYWIDGGMLYRLADAKAEQIAANASDVVVDTAGGKVYWTEETSNNTGKIHSANLDGSGAQVLKDLPSLPYGLALDSANDKLYLTNSRSKIRRMNIDGTQFEPNFIQGLSAPMNIAVSSGRVYWTEEGGNVRFANVEGTKVVRDIATGSGTLGGIAIGGNKVYWTEQTDETTGRVRSANLNGTGVAEVITLTTVPHGIAVDIADGKIFWADNQGRIQRIRVDNLKLLNVVTGLMAPSALALGVANTADATPPAATPVTKDTSVYDVNGDGTVDNTDVGIVVAALLSGNQPANLDVNDDGKVDITDVVAVSQNVDNSGAAAAPALRVRLTGVQVDRIQEQIDLLLAMNDRSPGALYTLKYLQNLLAVARPEKTLLLANYPNPFNPETWIPYELATDTNVQITIYDAQGVIIRTLSLGHQSAGYYTGRDRAAYWDGRNAFGEQVASGLYFYQFETDTMSLMRKMVILK